MLVLFFYSSSPLLFIFGAVANGVIAFAVALVVVVVAVYAASTTTGTDKTITARVTVNTDPYVAT